MNRTALVTGLALLTGLASCTTIHEDRRVLLDWNIDLIRKHATPWEAPHGRNGWDHAAGVVFNWVLVEPVAGAMVPITWAGDTFFLNVIDGYKKAEMSNHTLRFGGDEAHGTAESAVHGYGPLPTVTPWILSDAVAFPRFAAQWLWNSTFPADPHCPDSWRAYWNRHNEKTAR